MYELNGPGYIEAVKDTAIELRGMDNFAGRFVRATKKPGEGIGYRLSIDQETDITSEAVRLGIDVFPYPDKPIRVDTTSVITVVNALSDEALKAIADTLVGVMWEQCLEAMGSADSTDAWRQEAPLRVFLQCAHQRILDLDFT